MQLLRGLADDGRTVMVVTHSVAPRVCDKLLVMAPGGRWPTSVRPRVLAYFGVERLRRRSSSLLDDPDLWAGGIPTRRRGRADTGRLPAVNAPGGAATAAVDDRVSWSPWCGA